MSEEIGEAAQQVEEFFSELLDKSGFDLEMEIEEGENVGVRLSGSDSEILLSNNAKALDALNDLGNQIFLRRMGQRIEVDCDDYRLTRILELELLARNAAEKTRLSGQSFRFQPMPPSERRIIHVTLAEEPGVRTESRGMGTSRHVIVFSDASG
jgi:spoIIIJ-associated protein